MKKYSQLLHNTTKLDHSENILKKNLNENIFHVALILDGNRRWAKIHNFSTFIGHRKGLFTVRKIVQAAIENKITHLTLYAFSKENWKRSKIEIEYLMNLFSRAITYYSKFILKNNIKFTIIGDRTDIDSQLLHKIEDLEHNTKNNQQIIITAAISYGGQNEIFRAIKTIQDKNLSINTEEEFEQYLDSGNLPDVDLMIRTSGEQRISNFLLWKIAYAELYFCHKNWPDFTQNDLQEAIIWYKNRKRNFGK